MIPKLDEYLTDEIVQGGLVSELERQDIYQRILESLQTGVYLVDRNEKILFWNEGAEKITGHLRQDVLGHGVHEVMQGAEGEPDEELDKAENSIAKVLRDGAPTFGEVMLRHKAGHLVPVRMRAVAIRNDRGTVIGAAESFEESLSAADWERRQEKLAGYGALDPMTGVLTEGFMLSHLRENLRTFHECQVPFGVVSIQADKLDGLKEKYGPGVAPLVLRLIGQTLENCLRPTDFLGRRGEAAFFAILTECSQFDIDKVCERLKRSVHGVKVNWWGDRLPVTASLGATTVRTEDTVEDILARVDRSLLKSVAAGGNLISVARDRDKGEEAGG
ncbi:MAG TPA: GGDEF domain-containing protein [Candidatus Aquilonibacter sp.]|nr:GGDEF domain-containing protein [Candidatus Aquilonibacter sp.]